MKSFEQNTRQKDDDIARLFVFLVLVVCSITSTFVSADRSHHLLDYQHHHPYKPKQQQKNKDEPKRATIFNRSLWFLDNHQQDQQRKQKDQNENNQQQQQKQQKQQQKEKYDEKKSNNNNNYVDKTNKKKNKRSDRGVDNKEKTLTIMELKCHNQKLQRVPKFEFTKKWTSIFQIRGGSSTGYDQINKSLQSNHDHIGETLQPGSKHIDENLETGHDSINEISKTNNTQRNDNNIVDEEHSLHEEINEYRLEPISPNQKVFIGVASRELGRIPAKVDIPSWGETNYLGADNDLQRNKRRQKSKGTEPYTPNPFLSISTLSSRQSKFTSSDSLAPLASSGGFVATSPRAPSAGTTFDRYIQSTSPFREQSIINTGIRHHVNDVSFVTAKDGYFDKRNNIGIIENSFENEGVSVSISPSSLIRLAQVILLANKAFFGRFVFGTMLLVLPLYIGQRIMQLMVLEPMQDWYTGRYLRLTYANLEQQYRSAYHHVFPAALRSACRLFTHLLILFALGRFMEWMVGLEHSPCVHVVGGGCHWWCALLWMISVVGTGHSAGAAIAIWGGPLKLQFEFTDRRNGRNDKHQNDHNNNKNGQLAASGWTNTNNNHNSGYDHRPSGQRLFRRPLAMIHFMLDPDQWFREIVTSDRRRKAAAALKTFTPDPFMFPSTWTFLRGFLMMAVAKELYTSDMKSFMKLILIDQAFSDEWYRVVICEKRVGIGIGVMIGCIFSTFGIFWKILFKKSIAEVSSISTILMIPSVLAIIVSAWMNVLVFINPRMFRDNREAQKNQPAKQTTSSSSSSVKVNHQAPIVTHEHNNFAAAAAEALGTNLFPRPN